MSLPKIHCHVVGVPATGIPRVDQARGPMDLLPWADPYIALLLEKLEAVVAAEQDELARDDQMQAEIPPPPPGENVEFLSPGDGTWFWWEGR